MDNYYKEIRELLDKYTEERFNYASAKNGLAQRAAETRMRILEEKFIKSIKDLAGYYSEVNEELSEIKKERDHYAEGLKRLSHPDSSSFAMLSSRSMLDGAKMGVESAAKIAQEYLGETVENSEVDWFNLYYKRGEEIAELKAELMALRFGTGIIPKTPETWLEALLWGVKGLSGMSLSADQINELIGVLEAVLPISVNKKNQQEEASA